MNRKRKTYESIENGLTELLGINEPEKELLKYDKRSRSWLEAGEFYTHPYTQNKDSNALDIRDFRDYTRNDWNEACYNQRLGLGFKTNEELLEIWKAPNLEEFLKEDDNA